MGTLFTLSSALNTFSVRHHQSSWFPFFFRPCPVSSYLGFLNILMLFYCYSYFSAQDLDTLSFYGCSYPGFLFSHCWSIPCQCLKYIPCFAFHPVDQIPLPHNLKIFLHDPYYFLNRGLGYSPALQLLWHTKFPANVLKLHEEVLLHNAVPKNNK